jgi:hypothetical protein
MICEQCKAEGKTSRVTPGFHTTTMMYAPPYYDEQGHYHHHDPNSTTTDYHCSNGHQWRVTSRRPCPSCGER